MSVLPAPGDLLQREGPGLLFVLFGVTERLYDDFSTLHSEEITTQSGSVFLSFFLFFKVTLRSIKKTEQVWHHQCSHVYENREAAEEHSKHSPVKQQLQTPEE